jgi:hypothetical protein
MEYGPQLTDFDKCMCLIGETLGRMPNYGWHPLDLLWWIRR